MPRKLSFDIRSHILPCLVLLSFGPYIYKPLSLKVIDVFLVCFFIWSLVFRVKHKYLFTYDIRIYIILVLCLVFSTVLNYDGLTLTRFLASSNRILQFVYVYLICENVKSIHVLKVFKSYLFGLSINACIIYLQFINSPFFDVVKKNWFVDYSSSVAYMASTLGRLTGLINQPLESGLMYSIGLLILVYCLKKEGNKYLYFLPFLLFGGFLSISKVFIYLGFPFSVFFLLYGLNVKKVARFFFLAPFFYLSLVFILSSWEAREYLFRLFNVENITSGGIGFITSSRFGGEGTDIEILFSSVLSTSPVFGFGVGSATLMDNALIEFLYQGGIIALIFYLTFICYLFVRAYYITNRIDRIFILTLLLFLSFASVGAPVFTYSSFSTALISTLFFFLHKERQLSVTT